MAFRHFSNSRLVASDGNHELERRLYLPDELRLNVQTLGSSILPVVRILARPPFFQRFSTQLLLFVKRNSARCISIRFRETLINSVIEDYERGIVRRAAPSPLDAILFRVDQQNLSRADLVPYIGSLPKVSEVLSGRRRLSIAMIRRLHQGLGIPADVFLGAG